MAVLSDSEVEHTAAVVALLNGYDTRINAQTLDDIEATKAELPQEYCEVYVTERIAEGGRWGGRDGMRSWRVQVRALGKYEQNAKTVRGLVRDALEDHTVTVGGVDSTPMLRGVTDDPIRPDDGWYSGLSEFTYYC